MHRIQSVSGIARVTALALVAAAVISVPAFAADHVKVRHSADPQVTYKRPQEPALLAIHRQHLASGGAFAG